MPDPRLCTGVVVPMVSPLREGGDPDIAAVGRLVDHLIAGGVHGIFALGTTGESASISVADKYELVRATVKAVAGRVPTYAGISGNCLAESLEAAEAYHDLGVSVLVAHAPYFFPVPEAQTAEYFLKLADSLPRPLMAYNIPQTTHLSIPLTTVQRISQHPNIIGIKDSEPNFPRFQQLLEIVRPRADFHVLTGSSSLSCQSLRAGAHGLVPSTGNFAPKPYVALYEAAINGRWDEAASKQSEVDELSARYQKGRTLGESIPALKAILAAQGLCGPTALPPLRTMTRPA